MRLILAVAIVLGTFQSAHAPTQAEADHQVNREFRFFRIQVYNTFRQLRPEYDGRRAVGEAALAAWKEAGGQPHQAEALAQWYRDAKAASLPGSVAELPPLPSFPQAVAVETPAKAEPAVSRSESNWRTEDGGRYHVREVATRSIHHPHNLPGDAQRRRNKKQDKPQTVWGSVSRAFLKSLPLCRRGDEDK